LYEFDEFPDIPDDPEAPQQASPKVEKKNGAVEESEKKKQARRYLQTIEAAIEGQHGDDATYRVACLLVKDFALSDADALELLEEFNQKCQPPWDRRELEQKLSNARKYGAHMEGEKIRSESSGPRKNGHAEGRTESSFVPPTHWKRLDVATLRDWDCAPLRWTVQELIAEGNFVIVAAETQTGKTLLGLFLSHSILHKGKLFGRLEITPVEKILYFGLEDPERRFKARLLDMQGAFTEPLVPGRFIVEIAPDFSLTDERMFLYLEQEIVRDGFKLIFLDTYQKATPGLSSFDDEKQALILHKLANLTRKLGVTMIVLDHVRKRQSGNKRGELVLDDIKGTGAKPQNADCIILVERTPDRKQVKLQSFSKDCDVNVRFLLNVSPKGSSEPKFNYAADLAELGADSKARGEANRQKVRDCFKDAEKLSRADVIDRTKLGKSACYAHLNALVAGGEFKSEGKGKNCKYWRIRPIESSG